MNTKQGTRLKRPPFKRKALRPAIKKAFKYGFRIGVVIGVVCFSAFMLIKATHATYLLSPGHLSGVNTEGVTVGGQESHADFERECSHCHAPVHCVSDSKCQDCHFEIEQQRADTESLHGRLPSVSKCQDCHPEHNGAEADLTDLPFLNVDHYLLTGYSLEKHLINYDGSQMNCESCHQQDVNIMETMDCVSCHAANDHAYLSAHIEEYGTACYECHDGTDRMVAGFDHNTVYTLKGSHQDVDCAQCHSEKTYVGQSSACSDCHEPPDHHAGVFGANCAACHEETSFTPAYLRYHVFNLSMGNAEEEDCQRCHVQNYGSTNCESCHDDEEIVIHAGHEDAQNLHDCLSCHPTGVSEETIIPVESADGQGNAEGSLQGDGTKVGQGGRQNENENGNQSDLTDESEPKRSRPWWWLLPIP